MKPALFCLCLAGAFARGMFCNRSFLGLNFFGREWRRLRIRLRC
jgi:hypothetical protein